MIWVNCRTWLLATGLCLTVIMARIHRLHSVLGESKFIRMRSMCLYLVNRREAAVTNCWRLELSSWHFCFSASDYDSLDSMGHYSLNSQKSRRQFVGVSDWQVGQVTASLSIWGYLIAINNWLSHCNQLLRRKKINNSLVLAAFHVLLKRTLIKWKFTEEKRKETVQPMLVLLVVVIYPAAVIYSDHWAQQPA